MANHLALRCLICLFGCRVHLPIRTHCKGDCWLMAQEKRCWYLPRKLQKSCCLVMVRRLNLEHFIPWIFQTLFLESFPTVNFYNNERWFFTILAADHLGIFSYWRVDILSGAGDNTNEDSDVWFYTRISNYPFKFITKATFTKTKFKMQSSFIIISLVWTNSTKRKARNEKRRIVPFFCYSQSDHNLKILLIGNSGVGKSCILTRFSVMIDYSEIARQVQPKLPQYHRRRFRNFYINRKESKVHRHQRIKMQASVSMTFCYRKWDTAGQ